MRAWYALIGLLALPALAGGQSLGEAARKEHERREGLKKTGVASRTVTEEDLASTKGTVADGSATEPEPGDDGGGGTPQPATPQGPFWRALTETGSETSAPANGEAYWRGRVAEARARIDEARRRYDRLQRMIVIGQPAQYNQNGQRVIYSIYQMKERADAAEAELNAAEKALEGLYEEARHAGALPGWLR